MNDDRFNITAQAPTHAAVLELVLGNRRVRLTVDAEPIEETAELLARLEGAGYVFSQKRDGSWWWSDREDEGAFEGNDTPLPSKALAVAGAWAHFCERNRATGDGDWIEAHEALMRWRTWAQDHMGEETDERLREAIDRAWGSNSLKVRGALDRLFTALERAQVIDGQEHDGIADDQLIDRVIEMVPRLAALRRSTLDEVYEAHGETFTLPADVVEELKGAAPLLLERADAEAVVALRAAAGTNARVRELEAGIRRALDHLGSAREEDSLDRREQYRAEAERELERVL